MASEYGWWGPHVILTQAGAGVVDWSLSPLFRPIWPRHLLCRDEVMLGMSMKPTRPRAVVLCPTRELTEQSSDQFLQSARLLANSGLKEAFFCGTRLGNSGLETEGTILSVNNLENQK
ncbi:hypothetical protein E2562_032019 [Oryza meyeriana var. granulata]|uniref:DEAD/DEAH box helicase domain-containing protein n=1 Tax=Oryza meyeriana var. granulata TaxID=110450 RepID=A0A6G1FEU1_9ORYZ|nr:hypothetical protein E2562_032019 [Oryza meyeriana var. granulata]